ncbi:type II secretion system F family protein [Geobacter sp. SVR]|uniref:type II secretion system F family protein n=1 Tax=Geobacter sp. SVR TaxID=2495594 RepID=UPI001EF2B17C|nr:type II secretion system F family protein [Geobacter sp. SVR]
MSFFAYSAVDANGQMVKGTLESDDLDTASRDVVAKGLYLISIKATSSQLGWLHKTMASFQVKRMEVIEFAQSLAVMLKAGLPILTCLEDIIASTSNKALRSAIQDIRQKVEQGGSVSGALAAQGPIFPGTLKTLITVGEGTGRLDASLQEAADHLLRVQHLADAIKKALMYPAFAITTTLSALVFWLAFVLPKLTGTMTGMGVKLPALTRALISVSALFQAHWGTMLLALLLLPIAFYLLGKNKKARYYRDWAAIKIPIVRLIVYNKLLASFAEQFGILVAAGIAMDRLFDLLIPSLGNEYFAVRLLKAKENILNGSLISESLKEQEIFPNLVLRMISIGETSGTLDTQLRFLSGYYAKKLNDATESLGKLIEPLVMLVIGALFAVIIMGLMLPIYDLVSKMGK